MNILFLTTHLNTGGITSYLYTLASGLVQAGHKVWVASSDGNCIPVFKAVGIQHVKINIRTKSEAHPKLWLALPVLKRLVSRENIHIIHAHTRVTQVLGTALSGVSGINLVTTCHGFFRPRWFRKTFPCWGKAAIAISKPVFDHLNRDFHVDRKMIHLVPHGIDLNRFMVVDEQKRKKARQQLNLDDGPVIGVISRLSDVKGIDVLIKAMPLVLEQIPSAILMIIGQGPQGAYLRQMARDLSLTSHVRFESIINKPEELLGAFDVFVMPSLMEGLGLSVIEAQACGIPVVASRVGGLPDLIEDGISGYLVQSRDTVSLAGRVIDILKDPDKARGMGQQARLNVQRHFSSQRMVSETLKVYEQYSRR